LELLGPSGTLCHSIWTGGLCVQRLTGNRGYEGEALFTTLEASVRRAPDCRGGCSKVPEP